MIYLRTVPSSADVSSAATDVRNALTELDSVIESVTDEWAKLPAVYEAPEDDTLFAVFSNLPTIAESLQTLLGSAATALDEYATELQTLESQRPWVYSAAVEMEEEQPGSSWATVSAFNTRVREADETCANALRALSLDPPSHLDYFIGPYTAGSVAVGLTQGTLQWHKGALLTFRNSANIPAALINPTTPFDTWTKETFQGRTYGVNPRTGLLLPPSAVPPPEAPHVSATQLRAVPTPPPWAKFGAKGLGVLGAGVTLYGAWTNEYNESLMRHPELSESEHQAEATKRAAVTGGFEVAGALGGAAVGASWGASIGTAIPIPVVGTVVGGVVGGLVGGLIGGFLGNKTGEVVEEVVFD